MARTNGIEGLLSAPATSSGTVDQTGFDLYHLLSSGVGSFSATLNHSAAELEDTEFASTPPVALGYTTDLPDGTISFQARFPKGSPKTGAEGLITFASGYTNHANEYSIALSCSVDDGNAFAATPPTAMEHVPGVITATGSYGAAVDDTTAIEPAGTAGSATFRLDDDTTDNTLGGSIVLTSVSPAVVVGQQNRVTHNFRFDGNVTVAGSSPPLPTGALAKPDITEVVLRASGSRDYTVDAFWTALSFQVAFGQLIGVSGTLQCTGDLVIG